MRHNLRLFTSLIICFFALAVSEVNASVVFSFGSGNSVFGVDRSATFDNLTLFNAADLGSYTEDSLGIQTPSSIPNFDVFPAVWYPNGGYNSGISRQASMGLIFTTDGNSMLGVELQSRDWGWASNFPDFQWETYRNNVLTGSGLFASNTLHNNVIGWRDVNGIDEVRVGVFGSGFNFNNPFAFDNVNVELDTVPEPATLALLGLGLAGLGFSRRRH